MDEYRHLLSPGRIGTLELPNRLFQSAMGTNLAHDDGTVSDEMVAFYAARAAGGASLLTMGAVGVSYPRGQVQPHQVAISDDRYLPGLERLTSAIHREGGRVSAQLHHGGVTAVFDLMAGIPLLCPSLPLTDPAASAPPEELGEAGDGQAVQFKAMDDEDIAALIEDFASGAARAVAAGFDAIEVHAGHTYILASFLSPAENRRTDGYGGSAENRARLLREVLEAIRARIGRDFPVLCKINAIELHIENGVTAEDARVTARVAEQAGADAITATAQHDYSVAKAMFSSYLPHEPAKLVPHAAALKDAVSIPVVTVGRIPPAVADRAIGDGQFDFMAMGRKQIADADFARHLATGGERAVRPCIYDYRCLSEVMLGQPLRCAANGDAGREAEDLLSPAVRTRRVAVVGGGPAGMEAARRLTLRGHSVTLLEASPLLGGAARLAALVYPPNGDLLAWLEDQLEELRVDVRVGTPATVAGLAELDVDAVIVATGATYGATDIDCSAHPDVRTLSSLGAVLDPDGPDRLGSRVAIIGGDLVGLTLAECLLGRGHQVDVIDEEHELGLGLAPARRGVLLAEMAEEDRIRLHAGVTGLRVHEDGVAFTTPAGEPDDVEADAVIVVKGATPQTDLLRELEGAGVEVHAVGDAASVEYIFGAMRTAADAAARI